MDIGYVNERNTWTLESDFDTSLEWILKFLFVYLYIFIINAGTIREFIQRNFDGIINWDTKIL